jgi:hypothetical protein
VEAILNLFRWEDPRFVVPLKCRVPYNLCIVSPQVRAALSELDAVQYARRTRYSFIVLFLARRATLIVVAGLIGTAIVTLTIFPSRCVAAVHPFVWHLMPNSSHVI